MTTVGGTVGGHALSLADAAARHPLPAPWTPQAGSGWRRSLADEVEAGLTGLWRRATAAVGLVDEEAGPSAEGVRGVALACVGSLARREAGPGSDLDLVLLHDPRTARLDAGAPGGSGALTALADALWYPLWDAGASLDHSVRTMEECRTVASADLPAALGLLDLRHIAGDAELTASCASALLTDWRRATRRRLDELVEEADQRAARAGDLFSLLEPDLKEAHGGLRDAVLVRALAASSLTDRPHGAFDAAVDTLLDIRDALALTTGRPTNRLVLAVQDEVGSLLGLAGGEGSAGGEGPAGGEGAAGASAPDPGAPDRPGDLVLVRAYGAARRIGAALDATARTARRAARPARAPLTLIRFGRRSAPVLTALDDGVALVGDEVVLADGARPEADPALPLRVALAAGRRGTPISSVTRQSLARCPVPDRPWSATPARPGQRPTEVRDAAGTPPESALDLLVELLGLGPALPGVWEDLDLADLPSRWFPGWARVRNRPQHNPVHLYTVDRHMVRAAWHAGTLLAVDGGSRVLTTVGLAALDAASRAADRRVLLLAALFHDLGKAGGGGVGHAEAGAALVPEVLRVLAPGGATAAEVEMLVRHHLLLADASAKAPGDATVVRATSEALGTGEAGRRHLGLLRLLTEADARAAGPRAWTTVRSGVIDAVTRSLAHAL